MSNFIGPERRKEILAGVIVCGGKATDQDLNEIEKYRRFARIRREGEESGLKKREAHRYAAMEVYGNVNCE